MALEAISRGAASAVLVDASPKAVDIIKKNVQKTHFEAECSVVCADYADAVRRAVGQFDLVVLDPPYAQKLIAPALDALMRSGKLADGAIVICESGDADIWNGNEALAAHFDVRKPAKYGVAHVTILEYKEADHE